MRLRQPGEPPRTPPGACSQEPSLSVGGAGLSPGFGFFASAPTDGRFAALHGFDGNGPGTIRIGQDVTVTADGTLVEFDYRAAWDLVNFCSG